MMSKNEIIRYETVQLQKLKNVLAITNKILVDKTNSFHIIRVDRNRFSQIDISKELRERGNNILFKEFSDNELAFQYIEQCFKSRMNIDLIITENRNGVRGITFARELKKVKINFSKSAPLMLFMFQEKLDIIKGSIEPGLFDLYIAKDDDYLDLIIKFLENSIPNKPFST